MSFSNDEKLVVAYNRDDMLKEKHKYDMKESYSKGVNDGITQGIAQGKAENSKEIALNMLNKNIDINIISEVTRLSIDEINKLKDTE